LLFNRVPIGDDSIGAFSVYIAEYVWVAAHKFVMN